LHEPATVRSRLARVGSGALHLIGIGRAGEPQGEPIEKMPRSPMVLGYGNALYTLGWRYERGGANGNKPEAVRCYRKSARLGNLDATVRLAVIADEPPPIPVIPL
jgi:TPR repeat protein